MLEDRDNLHGGGLADPCSFSHRYHLRRIQIETTAAAAQRTNPSTKTSDFFLAACSATIDMSNRRRLRARVVISDLGLWKQDVIKAG